MIQVCFDLSPAPSDADKKEREGERELGFHSEGGKKRGFPKLFEFHFLSVSAELLRCLIRDR